MKIKLERLINSQTGEPLEVEIPENALDKYRAISQNGYEAGRRFRAGLESAGAIKRPSLLKRIWNKIRQRN